jgi:carbon monoxide dehydrogenase subunit G
MKKIQLTFHLRQHLSVVWDCLSNMRRFAEVHPVMERATQTGPGKYRMHERLPVACFKVPFSYPVVLALTKEPHTVKMHAIVMGLTHIHLEFRLFSEGNGTRVEEHASIRSPLPVHGAMRKAFEKYHPQLFEAIDRQQPLTH